MDPKALKKSGLCYTSWSIIKVRYAYQSSFPSDKQKHNIQINKIRIQFQLE